VVVLLCLLARLLVAVPVLAQPHDVPPVTYTYGNRPIDKLPKSHAAQPEEQRAWDETPPGQLELKLHAKDLFRIGQQDLERLCVVEARRPEDPVGRYVLTLREPDPIAPRWLPPRSVWATTADWIGPNQRMRPYWLPVGSAPRRLTLSDPSTPANTATGEVDLTTGAPLVFIGDGPDGVHEVDAGYALLPDSEAVLVGRRPLSIPVLIRPGRYRDEYVDLLTYLGAPGTELRYHARRTLRTPAKATRKTFTADTAAWPGPDLAVRLDIVSGDELLASRQWTLRFLDQPPTVAFGARRANLRYTHPITDGDTVRTWEDLWGHRPERDVVVSFPDTDARFVFWRGASYAGCWALPEAWLCYEWLEAEPDFYGAVDCVEPIMDKNCRYSRAEIVSSTPARAVVRWSYALTDSLVKVIRDERAEETFTLYPDGIGTRYLRAFYRDGWHETQEFLLLNRPGRRPSDALGPQAITFLSPTGERQTPVWPKPGFSLAGWPQVIAILNLGNGPYPFMVTPDAPYQTKVWADPYLEKPDLFNSYPHWPVTRGMVTSWLTDPADFARPTHSNLANLVNDPIRRTDEEKDYLWLVGVTPNEQAALEAARCWLRPGRIEPLEGVASGEYSQVERAYILRPTSPDTRALRFTLVPEPGIPVVNPAFIVERWEGGAQVATSGLLWTDGGQEEGKLCVWSRRRLDRPTEFVLRGRSYLGAASNTATPGPTSVSLCSGDGVSGWETTDGADG
jgi:hypothetical protein